MKRRIFAYVLLTAMLSIDAAAVLAIAHSWR